MWQLHDAIWTFVKFKIRTVSIPRNKFFYYCGLVPRFSLQGLIETLRVLHFRRTGKCDSKNRLDGKTVVITGGNTGIGKATAAILWSRGADVVITSRDPSKAENALNDIRSDDSMEHGKGSLTYVVLDLSSLESVRRCAEKLNSLTSIDILINNAGVMMPPYGVTEDGFEQQFGVNHLGHFLLTLLILPKILESAPARIVNVTSLAQGLYKNLDLDVMDNPKKYFPLHAYCRSKISNIMFTKHLANYLEGTGINVYAPNPGYVYTQLYRYGNETLFPGFKVVFKHILRRTLMKNTFVGAQGNVHCAICDKAKNQTGLYYDECRPSKYNKICDDVQIRSDLWKKSLVWVGLGEDYDIFDRTKNYNQEVLTPLVIS